jgi:hypothetical protein
MSEWGVAIDALHIENQPPRVVLTHRPENALRRYLATVNVTVYNSYSK